MNIDITITHPDRIAFLTTLRARHRRAAVVDDRRQDLESSAVRFALESVRFSYQEIDGKEPAVSSLTFRELLEAESTGSRNALPRSAVDVSMPACVAREMRLELGTVARRIRESADASMERAMIGECAQSLVEAIEKAEAAAAKTANGSVDTAKAF